MHNNIIFLFETADKQFLRLISEQVDLLKHDSKNSYVIINNILKLSLEYIDILPKHFFELLNIIKDLINNFSYYMFNPNLLHKIVDRILLLCSLLDAKPSIQVFEQFIQNEFETIYEYTTFPEEIILSIIFSLANISDISQKSSYNRTRLFWLVIASMDLSKKVLLNLIKYNNLKGKDFMEFCKNIAVSTHADEEVLLCLISMIEDKTISVKPNKNNYLKFELYVTIIDCALPSENVIKKIIEIVILKKDKYFKFFYEIIKNFRKNKTIMDAVIKRLNADELSISEELNVYIRRLKLVAFN